MPQTRTQRKLTAIMATDVVGYTQMMAEDEAGTLAALHRLDLSRFSAAPSARLSHLSFECDRAFPAQC
jgi:class 3 adenylate cyclase